MVRSPFERGLASVLICPGQECVDMVSVSLREGSVAPVNVSANQGGIVTVPVSHSTGEMEMSVSLSEGVSVKCQSK